MYPYEFHYTGSSPLLGQVFDRNFWLDGYMSWLSKDVPDLDYLDFHSIWEKICAQRFSKSDFKNATRED